MKQIVINGNKELKGEIKISGAKNGVVALIPAAILSDEGATLYNVPNISDTKSLIDILEVLNCKQEYKDEKLTIDTKNMKNIIIQEDLAKKYLEDKYIIAFEIGENQKEKIIKLAKESFPDAQIIASKDLRKLDRFVFIIKR